jgi:type VI secretion system protein ImpM
MTAAAFLFGKMPAHGDFVSRGTPDAMHQKADEAIAEALATAEDRWAEDWDSIYSESPVWRFAAAPGVFEDNWVAGVFVPSIDSVGRRFPLVAGVRGAGPAVLAVPGKLDGFLEKAENIARDALMGDVPADAFIESLSIAVAELASDGPSLQAGPGLIAEVASAGRDRSVWWIEGMAAENRLAAEGSFAAGTVVGLFRRIETPGSAAQEPPAPESIKSPNEPLEKWPEGAKITPGIAEGSS